MKKKRSILERVILLFLFLIILCIIFVVPYIDSINIVKYDDVELYENNNYNILKEGNAYKSICDSCEEFLPKYDEFSYRDGITGFYIFDGAMTLTREAISFVLELQFNEISEYEQFLLYEHNRCEYTDKYNIVYKNYDIFVTIDEKLTRFYYQEKLPYQFGMLCENKESLMIRYVYYSSHGLYDKFNDVFSNTNCEW